MHKLPILVLLLFPSWSDAQTPCCFEDSYTISLVELMSMVNTRNEVEHLTITANMAFDYANKMLGMEETVTNMDGTATEAKVIQDFDQMFQYYITGLSCIKVNMLPESTFPHCIPDDAALLGTHKAPLSGISIDIDTWGWYEDDGLIGNTTLSVLSEDCRLVSQQFMGKAINISPQQPTPTVFSITYSDHAYGVSQPQRYFNIPVYCIETEVSEKASIPNWPRTHSSLFNRFTL